LPPNGAALSGITRPSPAYGVQSAADTVATADVSGDRPFPTVNP